MEDYETNQPINKIWKNEAEEDYLYGDLEEEKNSLSFFQIQEKLEKSEKENHELKLNLEKSTLEIQNLKKENEILRRNISAIFKTAQLEIQRKDEQIQQLRNENLQKRTKQQLNLSSDIPRTQTKKKSSSTE